MKSVFLIILSLMAMCIQAQVKTISDGQVALSYVHLGDSSVVSDLTAARSMIEGVMRDDVVPENLDHAWVMIGDTVKLYGRGLNIIEGDTSSYLARIALDTGTEYDYIAGGSGESCTGKCGCQCCFFKTDGPGCSCDYNRLMCCKVQPTCESCWCSHTITN